MGPWRPADRHVRLHACSAPRQFARGVCTFAITDGTLSLSAILKHSPAPYALFQGSSGIARLARSAGRPGEHGMDLNHFNASACAGTPLRRKLRETLKIGGEWIVSMRTYPLVAHVHSPYPSKLGRRTGAHRFRPLSSSGSSLWILMSSVSFRCRRSVNAMNWSSPTP